MFWVGEPVFTSPEHAEVDGPAISPAETEKVGGMGRLGRVSTAIVVISGLSAWIAPAAAQFGGIFGDPPRPPGNVPNRPPVQDDRFMPPTYPQNPQPVAPAPPQVAPAPPPAQQGAIQSQPLAPPPGLPPQQASAPPGQPLPPPNAPGQPLPPFRPGPAGPAPADSAPRQGEEVVTAPPAQKIVNPTAVFAGLDKITGRITKFDVAINETVQFGALQVTPRVCYTRPPTETQNTDSFVQVDEITLQGEVKRIFSGWMFAASPGLHGVEHPIYDVWLTDCKGGAPPVAQVQAPAPAPAPARPTRPPPRPQQPPPRFGPTR
jgi:hypothetical protein